MSTFNVSPGAYVREIDLSYRVQAISSSIGAIVVQSSKGRTDRPYLCTSVADYLDMFGAPHPKYGMAGYSAITFLEQSSRLWVKRVAKGALHGGVVFSKVPQVGGGSISALKPLIIGESDPFNTLELSDDMIFCVFSIGPGKTDLTVTLEPNNNTEDGGFWMSVYEPKKNTPTEKYLVSLEYRTDGFGSQMFIEQRVNIRSKLVRVIVNKNTQEPLSDALVDNGPTVTPMHPDGIHVATFGGGVDAQPISLSDPADVAYITQAWDQFADPEALDVNILINGGWTQSEVQLKMDQIAQNRRDCIAVLDVPSDLQDDVNKISLWRKGQDPYALTQIDTDGLGMNPVTAMFDSSYSAIYTPDLLVYDQYNSMQLYVPPSGHVAAAYARTDKERALWFSPAGMVRGRLNVQGVRKVYNEGMREVLTAIQINPMRVVPNHGIKIWGDSTAQTRASALSNVNVRRLLCYLEKSLSIALMYSVFDPNDNILRAQIRSICDDFLRPLQYNRAIKEYAVVCDDRNNLPENTDAGELRVDVYLKPVLPSKVIVLSAVLTKTGADFNELIASNAARG